MHLSLLGRHMVYGSWGPARSWSHKLPFRRRWRGIYRPRERNEARRASVRNNNHRRVCERKRHGLISLGSTPRATKRTSSWGQRTPSRVRSPCCPCQPTTERVMLKNWQERFFLSGTIMMSSSWNELRRCFISTERESDPVAAYEAVGLAA